MRLPYRASKRSNHYNLETIERRLMLSASVAALPQLPSTWVATPAIEVEQNAQASGSSTPSQLTSPAPGSLTPAEMVGAYGVSSISFNGVVGNGQGQTIAIVDAYDDPNALTDLEGFDAFYNLPNPPSFTKLNQQGLASPLPGTDPAGANSPNGTWEEEESLDIEWAHVIAPAANIILFEANDPGNGLYQAVQSAASTPGVSVVSMSWSGDENSAELSMDSVFTTPAGHEPVTFLSAAGDEGYYSPEDPTQVVPQYPASSPNVVAVGGTTLTVSGDSYGSETGWGNGVNSNTLGGGGGGISSYEPQPTYQRFLATQSSTFRTYPDVSMDADPNTGVAIYDTFDFGATTPWVDGLIGGTSLATPMFAALVSIADQGRVNAGLATLNGPTQTLPRLYDLPSVDYHDITAGNNGYQAGVGYDLVTGRGSPVANLLVPDLAASYIGSYAFNDSNIDGVQESGETGVAGVTVNLESSAGVILQTTSTDSQGLYEFVNVTAGSYLVNFVAPPHYTISPEGSSTILIANSDANPSTGDTAVFVVGPASEFELANVGVFEQTISINDVTITRPHTGTAPMVFTVTLSPVNPTATDVPFATANGTAIAGIDYDATSGALVFPIGVTTETITVQAIGNLTIENDVSYAVNLTPPPNFFPLKATGIGTIDNSNFPVATVAGPPPQTRSATLALTYPFVITLSASAPFDVSVPYTTMDQSAVAGVDYVAATGTAVFPAGTTSETINVTVNPGTNPELDKTFLFELTVPTAPVSETVGTPSQAIGTILTNVLPQVSTAPSSVTESPTGLAYLPFNVTVTPSLSSSFTVSYTTSNGTAVAGADYTAESGVLTFGPGRAQETVYVPVYREFIAQQQKTLSFSIFNASANINIVSPVVTGTINYLALSTIPFAAGQRAVYADALNQIVTVSMQGYGSGEVVFLGSVSNATNAYEILVDNTDPATSLTVKVGHGGQTSLTNLIVSSPIGTINARTTNIVGSVSATSSVAAMNLGYIDGSTITVGGAGTSQSLSLDLNRVLNSTITSAIAIKSLTAGAYVDTTGSPIYITAPSVGVVRVKGNFGGTIQTTSIQTLAVSGVIDGGGVLASDSIGTVSATGIIDSTFFAGVTPDLTALPTSSLDFSNTKSEIHSISVHGGVFSNSLISGWKVDSVKAGDVTTTAAGANFGISATQLGKIQAVAGVVKDVVALNDPTESTAVGNFVIKPV